MKHFVHKIDASGLFVEDCFWEDNAKPEVPAQDSIPAVLDDEGNVVTPEVPAVAAIPAYLGDPIPDDLIEEHVPGGFHWPKWDGTQWVEGGTAPAPQVPTVVSMRQARLALLGAGLLSTVDAAIAAQAEPLKSQIEIEWVYATEIDRQWPTLLALAPALGIDSDDLDNLFIAASQL